VGLLLEVFVVVEVQVVGFLAEAVMLLSEGVIVVV
jgi:hypothetical protein